jgi:16S rRNA (guanine966-N2)-methyltransferase
VFIEINFKAYKVIQQNLKSTQFEEFATVKKMDAFTYLTGVIEHQYDVVYIAPPQYLGIWVKAMQTLDENPDWVAKYGKVIVQIHPKEYDSKIYYSNFNEIEQRNYGDTRLIFYERVSVE